MNNNRTTKTFKTPGGHEVVMYDFITGREAREIKDQTETGNPKSSDNAHDHALKMVVVSLDGSTEDTLKKILDLPLSDFVKITEELTVLLDTKKK